MFIKPTEFQSFWSVGSMSSTLNPNLKSIQIGVRCSGTKKCSQRHQIDHFCQGFFSAIQPLKYLLKYNSNHLLKYFLKYQLKYFLKYFLKYLSNYLLNYFLKYLLKSLFEYLLKYLLQGKIAIPKKCKTPPPNSLSSFRLVI